MKPGRIRRLLFVTAGVLLLIVAGALIYRHVPVKELVALVNDRMPPWLFVCLMVLLPLTGFPVTVFFALAGAIFPMTMGLAVTAIVLPFHMAGFFLLAKVIKIPIEKVLAWKNYTPPRVPAHRRASFCLIINILPLPYTVKNYLLPLAGLPFSIFFWISWPVQLVMALPAVLIGSAAAKMDPMILAVAVGLFVLLYVVVRRIEKRFGNAVAARENGQEQ